jgi:hypothetical protein
MGGDKVGTGSNGSMLLGLDFHYGIDQPGSNSEYIK